MESEPVILLDSRSAAETDDRCGMRYWWNYQESGTGIVPIEEPDDLAIGRETHEDLEAISEIPDRDLCVEGLKEWIKPILDSLTSQDRIQTSKMEHLYRRLGWLAAFGLFIEPRLREEFETIATEGEIILDREPLWVPVIPDRLLVHRRDKYMVYKEWKSTISAGPKWMAYWTFAPQLHLGIKAIQEEYGVNIKYAQIVGLLKGDQRGDRLSHTFVWGWRSSKTGAWTHEYAKARTAEWEATPVWEFEGGPVGWIKELGETTCRSQFPHSYPVFLNEKLLNDWLARREIRQWQVREVREECQVDPLKRALYFEPRTAQCRPAFGPECPYLASCWIASVNENPLASGLYKPRIPHHEVEKISQE